MSKLIGVMVTLSVLFILVRALGSAQANRMLDKVIATALAQIKALL